MDLNFPDPASREYSGRRCAAQEPFREEGRGESRRHVQEPHDDHDDRFHGHDVLLAEDDEQP